MSITLVSQRVAEAISELGVTGTRTYDVDLVDRKTGPIEGHVGFVPSLDGTGELFSYDWRERTTSYAWIMSERVLNGLTERGSTCSR